MIRAREESEAGSGDIADEVKRNLPDCWKISLRVLPSAVANHFSLSLFEEVPHFKKQVKVATCVS